MALFDSLFYSGPMLAVFGDESRLQSMLDFETALAFAEAECGVIPAEAAEAIAAECRLGVLDAAGLREGAERSGTLALPLVEQLSRAVEGKNPEAAKYVHWGATSQDVIDTGFILQARAGLDLLEALLDELCAELALLAERHGDTTMAGRTWLQQAVPVTLGWKAAGWLDAMLRHRTRLDQARGRALTLQFGGAAGTLASLGDEASAVAEKLAGRLGLAAADISWHASRDRSGELATTLGLLTATLGKIAKDISLLMQTEVGEVFEAGGAGRGVSSTMPQKRNPVGCAAILAAAVRVPGLVATTLTSMVQEHERGLGNWPAEWETLPEIFNLCAGALERTRDLIAGLEVDRERMTENLELTGGLIFSEAVATALAARLGRAAAHELVQRASRTAIEQHRRLRDILMEDPEIGPRITPTELERLFDPANYLGITRQSVRRVLDRAAVGGHGDDQGATVEFLDLHDLRTHYRWDGASEKPVLLLANGLGTNLAMWDGQIPEFSRHFRVLRYDERGHGQSSVPPGPYSIEQLGRDALALLDALEIESCLFCGLSMGGVIGQWLGANAPSRMRKLALCNTAAKIGTEESWNARIDLVLKGGVEAAIPLVLDRWFTGDFQTNAPDVVARIRKMFLATDPAGYVGGCAAIREMDQREMVHRIELPTLIVAGAHDAVTPPAEGKLLAGKIAGAKYVELHAAHMSNVEAREEFNPAVLKFLLS